MPELIEAYWPYLLTGLAIGLAVAWFVLVATRKTSVVREEKTDVLDEGAAPAARNQALIDAPTQSDAPSAIEPDSTPAVHSSETERAPEPIPSAPAPPTPASNEASSGDDLTVIKGLGPKLATTLNGLGITTYAQIANWTESDIREIDSQLDRFQGRIERDNWVEQAKLLISGDDVAFSAKFGQNG